MKWTALKKGGGQEMSQKSSCEGNVINKYFPSCRISPVTFSASKYLEMCIFIVNICLATEEIPGYFEDILKEFLDIYCIFHEYFLRRRNFLQFQQYCGQYYDVNLFIHPKDANFRDIYVFREDTDQKMANFYVPWTQVIIKCMYIYCVLTRKSELIQSEMKLVIHLGGEFNDNCY
jgi:hypothetical protein